MEDTPINSAKTVVSLAVITETKRPVKGRYERAAFGCSLVFEFPLTQLATYADKLEELRVHPNPFALAVAVQLKALETRGDNQRRVEWKRAFIVGLYRRGFPRDKIIALLRFMDEAMRLPTALEEIIQETIHRIEEGTKMPYVTSWEKMALEQGVQQGVQQGTEQGLQQGLQQGLLEAVLLQLAHRLGDLKQATQTKLRKLSLEQLQALLVALLDFNQPADLQAWLKAQSSSVTKPVQKANRKHAK